MTTDPWVATRAQLFRGADPALARWAEGYGPIRQEDVTQLRVHEMATLLVAEGKSPDSPHRTVAGFAQ